jgi:hypothetical protein
MTVVTRMAIADHVSGAFASGGARKADLLAVAASTKAPPPILHQLAELPDRQFAHLRDLWTLMPEVPVE